MIELKNRTEDHVRIYFKKTQDAEIAAMIPQTAETLKKALENYEKARLPEASCYGRTIYIDGVYIGDIWCYCIDKNEIPNAMLSYCIFEKTYWGRGIATEAVRLFLQEIICRYAFKTIGAFSYLENIASLKVLEKNSFRREEIFSEDGIQSVYYQKDF